MEDNNIDTTVVQHNRVTVFDSNPVIINATDVAKEYKVGKQKIKAVDGVSVEIHKGEFVALVGSSGSGKSTLLHLLGGLDKPTAGEIIVEEQKIRSMSDRRLSKFRNQTIGFVFQSFYLQPFLTLRRNIEVASMPQRMKLTCAGNGLRISGVIWPSFKTIRIERFPPGRACARSGLKQGCLRQFLAVYR